MKQSSKNRSRRSSGNNNSNRKQMGNVANRVFESAGPEGKVRGTPSQVIAKYQTLMRDASLSGDRVAAENHQQHAEHYIRLLQEYENYERERRAAHEARQNQRTDYAQDENNDNGSNGNNSSLTSQNYSGFELASDDEDLLISDNKHSSEGDEQPREDVEVVPAVVEERPKPKRRAPRKKTEAPEITATPE